MDVQFKLKDQRDGASNCDVMTLHLVGRPYTVRLTTYCQQGRIQHFDKGDRAF